MSNLIDDVLDEAIEKADKKKPGMKWYWKLTIFLVTTAFIVGQYKIIVLNKIDNYEKQLNNNSSSIIEIKHDAKDNYDKLNSRIDVINIRIDNLYNNKLEKNN